MNARRGDHTVEIATMGTWNDRTRRRAAHNAAGFTLIELAVTVAVLALLLAIAFPSFETMVNQNRLAAASNQVIATLQQARLEAVRQNRRVMICNSGDGVECQCCERKWDGLALVQPVPGQPGTQPPLAFTRLSAPVELLPGHAFNSHYWTDMVAYRGDGRPARGPHVRLPKSLPIRVCIPTTRPANNIRDVMLHASGRVSVIASNGNGACRAPDTTPS